MTIILLRVRLYLESYNCTLSLYMMAMLLVATITPVSDRNIVNETSRRSLSRFQATLALANPSSIVWNQSLKLPSPVEKSRQKFSSAQNAISERGSWLERVFMQKRLKRFDQENP